MYLKTFWGSECGPMPMLQWSTETLYCKKELDCNDMCRKLIYANCRKQDLRNSHLESFCLFRSCNGGLIDSQIQTYENSELWGELSALRLAESEGGKNQMLDTHKCFLNTITVCCGFASFLRNTNDSFPKCEPNSFLCSTKISGKSLSLFWK